MNLLKKPKRAGLKLIAKTKRTLKNIRVWKNTYRKLSEEHVAYATSSALNHDAHGRGFMLHLPEKTFIGPAGRTYTIKRGNFSYESRFILGIHTQQNARKLDGTSREVTMFSGEIAHLSLGFAKDTLVIEAMQTNTGVKTLLNEFRRLAKEKPLDKLLQEAENLAKERGLTQIIIRRPETHYYYHHPETARELSPVQRKTKKAEIQRQMKELYRRIALNNGFKPEELFYVKRLA